MSAVREVAFRYSAKGAKAVQRADSQVQSAVNQTAKDARKNSGEINRWLERNKTAIGAIAGASLAAMGAIISASPTARAELAGVRSAFTLFADDVVNDVLPAGDSLTNKAFEIQEAYAELPDPIRETISTLLIGAGAFFAIAGVVVLAAKVIGGFIAVLAPLIKVAAVVVGAIAGIISIKVILIALLAVLIAAIVGFVAAYILNWKGARDKTNEFVRDIYDTAVGWLGRVKDRGIELISDLVNGFVDWIKKLPDRTATWLSDVYDEVKDRLAGLRDDALGWGKDMVNNFIDGIKSRLSNLRGVAGELREAIPFIGVIEDMVKQITKPLKKLTQEIRDYLPSSPAKKGPLSDLNKVERAIPNALNGGLEGGVNNVQQNLTGRVGRSVSGGGGQSVSIGEINVEVMGGGTGRRTGKDIAQEVSKEINNQFESRR